MDCLADVKTAIARRSVHVEKVLTENVRED